MAPTHRPVLTVRSPADLIAAVPYLLGFRPAGSVVVVAFRDRRVAFAARGDLPAGAEVAPADRAADYLAAVVHRQGVDSATVVGYGPADRVTPTVDAVAVALRRLGLPVLDVLRVSGSRYWSYVCTDPGCCPAEGVPFDDVASPLAVAATVAGQVALPDRESLIRGVGPVDGPSRESMRLATGRARQRLAELLSPASTAAETTDRVVRDQGTRAVRQARSRYRAGGQLTDDETAWLSLLLDHLPVRDDAWEHARGEDWQLTLWTDVLRRAEPELVPAPASLLGFVAWRAGQGALASVALDRALRARPDYSMALLLTEALRNGLPPSALDGRRTGRGPGQVVG